MDKKGFTKLRDTDAPTTVVAVGSDGDANGDSGDSGDSSSAPEVSQMPAPPSTVLTQATFWPVRHRLSPPPPHTHTRTQKEQGCDAIVGGTQEQ